MTFTLLGDLGFSFSSLSFQTWRKIVTVEGFIGFTSSSNDPFVFTLFAVTVGIPAGSYCPFCPPCQQCSFCEVKKTPENQPDNQAKPTTNSLSPVLDALSPKSYCSCMSYSLSLPLSVWSHCGILLYKILLHYRKREFFYCLFF